MFVVRNITFGFRYQLAYAETAWHKVTLLFVGNCVTRRIKYLDAKSCVFTQSNYL